MAASSIVYVLIYLLEITPQGMVVQLVDTYPDKPACEAVIKKQDLPKEQKEKLICQGFLIEDQTAQPVEPSGFQRHPQKCEDFNGMKCKGEQDMEVSI